MASELSSQSALVIDAIGGMEDPEVDVVEHYLRGNDDLVPTVRMSVREGIDEVIDGRRTRRYAYKQLSSAEKSFCGVRIEGALVRYLELPLGERLDLSIEGLDVDVKVSSKEGWMIGPSQVGAILLLVCFSEEKRNFSVGVVRGHLQFMNPSKSRDAKRSLSKQAKRYIRWIVRKSDLPVSILASLPRGSFEHIVAAQARADRLRRFLALIPSYVPFPRQVIETVVGGDDPLRGSRHDTSLSGGEHPLGDFRILSYRRNSIVTALGYPPLGKREHMKVMVRDLERALSG